MTPYSTKLERDYYWSHCGFSHLERYRMQLSAVSPGLKSSINQCLLSENASFGSVLYQSYDSVSF